jgi:hypothetical protein
MCLDKKYSQLNYYKIGMFEDTECKDSYLENNPRSKFCISLLG